MNWTAHIYFADGMETLIHLSSFKALEDYLKGVKVEKIVLFNFNQQHTTT